MDYTKTYTMEEIMDLFNKKNQFLERQRQVQAEYYQRHAEERKAYARAYYQRKKAEKQARQQQQ